MAFEPGQNFDRYFVEDLIGEGGMGRVYRAFDTRLERHVALKVLHDAGGDAGESVAVALREARAAAAIAHPNATAVYDAHEVDGTSFIAMELVAGTSLRSILRDASRPPVPLSTCLRWLIDVAAALGAAHRMGVVHRDVKPENVMVRDDGLVKVLDFGVARRTVIEGSPAPPGSPVTQTSGARIAGTPAYMAPEQIRGDPLDGRADQFGWGVLAYELLTHRLPWKTAKDLVGFIAAVVTEEPAPPSSLTPGIPAAVDAAVLRALAKSPANRFPSMLAAAAELAPYARSSLTMSAVEIPEALSVAMSPSSDPCTDPTVAFTRGDEGALAPKPSSREGGSASRPSSPDGFPRPPSIVPDRPSSSRHPPPASPLRGSNEAPSSSRSRASETRLRPPSRPRRPFGPGFHEPDFEAAVDLEGHLALLPQEASCKGMFLADVVQRASRVTAERALFRAAELPERRYVAFRDYPLAENMKLTMAAARALFPRYPLGEGLRRLGQTAFETVLTTHIGRALFGILGRDVEPILLTGPKAFKLMVNVGLISAEKTSFRTFTFSAHDFPAFLETYQVGVLEGVLRHCGERGRIRIAVEDLAHATIELHLL
jgi:uncharacterized protein (TIGR02265 family)